jgi:phosphate-selective porin OprO/OprP
MRGSLLRLSSFCLALAPTIVTAAEDAEAQNEIEPKAAVRASERRGRNQGFRFVFNNRPSIRWGNMLRVDFRFKSQNDVRAVEPNYPTDEGLFEMNRGRVGVEGHFLRHFEYEVEREIKFEISELLRIQPEPSTHVWRDVFVNFRYFRDFQIKVGKFKIPFSLDQTTGTMNLDFPFRSLAANYLAPARDLGIMAHGRIWNRGFGYEAGVFRNDGENAEYRDVVSERGEERFKSGVRAFAGRVVGKPLRLVKAPGALKEIELGGAFVSTSVPEGLKGLRGRTELGETFFDRIFVHGHRLRIGTQFLWTPGPFSLKSEFIHVSEERRGQGIRGNDLPNLIGRAWYVSGTWVITGQRHVERDEPRKSFPPFGRGLGAVELAGRYEALRFGSAEHPGNPSRTPRAANILGNSNRAVTMGVNWYLNRHTKVQTNWMYEKIEDLQRTPVPGSNRFWTRMVRIQFVL